MEPPLATGEDFPMMDAKIASDCAGAEGLTRGTAGDTVGDESDSAKIIV